ncbi:uncharacterized protein LY79DRAFT_674161 [Colletotrichum navitas]|uniref:Uncharacterized protein n=1 Tax=Colletotrichum navitas TaxID=681940 RepID=A0AAD8PMY0_9PEZI|nr:uncharacterized protein LY79DRAFT_674161 [Colletotrichum navitas]KAK1570207.1 hypothetical protein LY79DRAFT_674161 [Colletotrichum navitas]
MATTTTTTTTATATIRLPRSPYTRAKTITTVLRSLQRRDGEGPYVHGKQISFFNGRNKDDWNRMLPDPSHRDNISAFLKAPKAGKQSWVGFFSCPQRSWVGSGNAYKSADWHCFAALVVADGRGRGKHLLLYDNDAKAGVDTASSRISDVLWGLQKSLWETACNSGRYTLWYSTDRSRAGTDMCLRHALEKVQEWAALQDQTLDSESDARLSGFVKLFKK